MGRRTYTLTVSCEDAAGNAATTTVPVIVTLLPPALLDSDPTELSQEPPGASGPAAPDG